MTTRFLRDDRRHALVDAVRHGQQRDMHRAGLPGTIEPGDGLIEGGRVQSDSRKIARRAAWRLRPKPATRRLAINTRHEPAWKALSASARALGRVSPVSSRAPWLAPSASCSRRRASRWMPEQHDPVRPAGQLGADQVERRGGFGETEHAPRAGQRQQHGVEALPAGLFAALDLGQYHVELVALRRGHRRLDGSGDRRG